jgi:hypothetical protein
MRSVRKLIMAGIAVTTATGFASSAQAGPECYRLSPFIDTLKLAVGNRTLGHIQVFGNWIASENYTLPASGAYEFDVGTKVRRFGLVATNANPEFFGGNLICGLDGIPGSSFVLQCSGGDTTYSKTGTLTPISCAGIPPSSTAKGRAAGSK